MTTLPRLLALLAAVLVLWLMQRKPAPLPHRCDGDQSRSDWALVEGRIDAVIERITK